MKIKIKNLLKFKELNFLLLKMLKIKLTRTGRKKSPFYKIVLIKNLTKRNGKIIKELGYYNPLNKNFYLNKIQTYFYIKNGVYLTDTVRHLIYKFL